MAHPYFSELDGIKGALKENKELGAIKKLFLRKVLLQKVKQHDSKLSNVLQTFNVRCPFTVVVTLLIYCLQLQLMLMLDARFAQLAEGRKVNTGQYGPITIN